MVAALLPGCLAVVAAVTPAGATDPSVSVARAIEKLGGDSRFTLSMDIAHGRARTDWVRYRIAPMKRTFVYSEVIADGLGYVAFRDDLPDCPYLRAKIFRFVVW